MKFHFRLFVSLLPLFAAFAQRSDGQNINPNDAWRWVHFGPKEGISGEIYSTFKDRDSMVWAASDSAVFRFDGYRWNIVDRTSEGLAAGPVRQIFSDPWKGTLFIKIENDLYERTPVRFEKILSGVDDAVPAGPNILIFIRGDSLYRYRDGQETLLPNSPRPVTGDQARSLWYTNTGHVWLAAQDGIYRWENGIWIKKLPVTGHYPVIQNLIEQPDSAILFSINLPTERMGIWQLDRSNKLHFKFPCAKDCRISLQQGPHPTRYAIFTSNQLSVYEQERLIVRVNLPFEGLRVHSITYAQNGDIWFGAHEGVCLYHAGPPRWDLCDQDRTGGENVLEIARARDGRIWTGTQHGIEIYAGDRMVQSIGNIAGVDLTTVTGLAEDADGNIWISSGSGFTGTFRWNGSRWEHFAIDSAAGDIHIHKIRKDHSGRLWFLGLGTYFDHGFQPGAYVYIGRKFQRWGEPEGLLNGRVYSFDQSSDGSLWFGTYKGLSCFTNGKWRHWSIPKDLTLHFVFALAIDREDNVWFSDRSTTLGCLRPNGQIIYSTTEDGLPDIAVWDIKVDSAGIVWVSTAKGLAAFRHGSWTTYDTRNSAGKNETWPLLPLGKDVYAGTLGKGLLHLYPDQCVQPAPKIFPENTIVDGGDALLRWRPYGYCGEPAEANILTRYRINNERWSPWSTTHEAMLTHLPEGSYFYRIQARNLFGVVDSSGHIGYFTIPPPLFFRPAFLIPLGILAFGLALVGIIYVISIKKKILP